PYEHVRAETPLYYDPSRCIDALASLVEFRERREKEPLPSSFESPYSYDGSDETRVLSWHDASELLADYGVGTVETCLIESPDEAAKEV
ncbi:MAG: CoA-binding protein, partial [Halobacteria archaeon]|nr:CoA-binding protein [Halobacteria archaeon]